MQKKVVVFLVTILVLAVPVLGNGIDTSCINKENADNSWVNFVLDGGDEKGIFTENLDQLYERYKRYENQDLEIKNHCQNPDNIDDTRCHFLDGSTLVEMESAFGQADRILETEIAPSGMANTNLATGEKTNVLATWLYNTEEMKVIRPSFKYDNDLALYLATDCGGIEGYIQCTPRLIEWPSGPGETDFSLSLSKGWNVLILIVDTGEKHYLRYTNPESMISNDESVLMYSDPSQAQPDQPCTTTEVKDKEGQTRATYTKICNRNQCAFEEECVNPGILENDGYVCEDDDIYFCQDEEWLTPSEEFLCSSNHWQTAACEEGKQRITSEGSTDEDESACCNPDQCTDDGRCYDKSETSGLDMNEIICLENQNWAVCDEDRKTTTIDDQSYICKDSQWEVLQPEADCKNNEADTNGDGKSGCEDPTCLERRCTDGGGVCGREFSEENMLTGMVARRMDDHIGQLDERQRVTEDGRTVDILSIEELPLACIEPPTLCSDKKDNDEDGKIDCLDVDCHGSSQCEFGKELTCNDGFDNDGDTQFVTAPRAPEEQEAQPLRIITIDAIAIDALTGMAVATENIKPGFWERTKLFIKNIFSRERAIAGQAQRQVCGPNTRIISGRNPRTGQVFIVCRCLEGFEDEDDNKVNGCEIRVPNLEGLKERAQQAEEQQRDFQEDEELIEVNIEQPQRDFQEDEELIEVNIEQPQRDFQEDEELIKVNIDQPPIQVNVKHGTDCQDSDCIRKQGPSGICCITDSHCGSGAMCSGNSCIESNCLVGSGDNDKDGLEDNEDPDCYFQQCTDETGRNAKQWQEGECKGIALAQQATGDVRVQVDIKTGKLIVEYYSENTVIVKEEGACNDICQRDGKMCLYGNGVPPGGRGKVCDIISTECWCMTLPD